MGLKLFQFPDDEALLRSKSEKIVSITNEIKILAEEMIDLVNEYNAFGLAAIQVGYPIRLIVVKVNGIPNAYINPVIIESKGKKQFLSLEGCLCISNRQHRVLRDKVVVIKALNLEGKEVKLKALDYTSACFQHEIDHLNGILFIDRIK